MSSIVGRIESDGRLRIPNDWGEGFAPEQDVELVRCEEGILVKPIKPGLRTSIQRALERKLLMHGPTHLDLADVDMDQLGW